MYIELVRRFDERKRRIWQTFLRKAGLEPDDTVTQTALLWEGETLVAAGSREGEILKCIAVEEDRQGEDLASVILSALRQEAFSEGHRHLFVYTKPENERLFSSLFFYPVAKTDTVLLMENRRNGIGEFLDGLPRTKTSGHIGAVVMNGNPFTRGHRYLIETAARDCDHLYVFVVSENKSRFSFRDRLRMAELGTADLPNVSVLPTGPYLVSSATFPTYFLKEREKTDEIHCLLDIEIFTTYFVPKFAITRRYVGTEPLSPMTDRYNRALKAGLPPCGIELLEIPRLHAAGEPVSASAVRRAIEAGDVETVKALVPDTTFHYLTTLIEEDVVCKSVRKVTF